MASPAGYHDEAAVAEWFTEVAGQSDVTVREIGRSVDGRVISAVDVHRPTQRDDRPLAAIVANIHVCEVVSSELAIALVAALTAPSTTSDVEHLLQAADVTVVPVVNPDGRQRSLKSLHRRRACCSTSTPPGRS